MSLFDGVLLSLVESPAFQDAINKFDELRSGTIAAAKHFDERLEAIALNQKSILEILEYQKEILINLANEVSLNAAQQKVMSEGIAPVAPCNFDVNMNDPILALQYEKERQTNG